jgi:hypothetical protein|nr:MAG TPA: hypothetical protein [Caudoviricetes sp.]
MSVEDIENGVENIINRWDNKQENPTSTLGEDEALEMGILQPEEAEDNNSQINEEYTDAAPEEKEYEKLDAWNTTKDIAKSVGVEALHFFQPKDRETQYESRTHFGENMKYLYRYGVGTAAFLSSFLWGGGEVATAGALVKGATMLPKAAAIGGGMIKFGQGLQKLSQAGKVINTTKAGLQAARAGKNVKAAIVMGNTVNAAVDGLVAGALADFTLYRPEENEGHLADAFGETNNPLISFLQTNDTDSAFEGRLKNVVDGVLIGIPFGATLGGGVASIALTPTVRKFVKGLHGTLHAKTAEEASEALIETTQAKVSMDNLATTLDMVNEVDLLRKEAQETGEEVSQLIADRLPNSKIEEAQAIAKLREAGEEIFPYEDGTWSIRVEKWEDAYKLTPEQYQAQLKAQDPSGNLSVSHMNSAVVSTWQQRGLIDGDGLLGSSKERTNTTKAIVDYYKDKWELEKKSPKINKSAIDKKKLQIKKIEDKITMVEGGNKEVSDPLDNLKEELRIAQEELKKLETPKEKNKKITVKYGDWSNIPDGKTTQYKNGNVLIQINNNSQDIYATLRSELEHARDFVKGEVPDQNLQHFSRYEGMNEAEVAPSYTYKKSKGKASKTGVDTSIREEEPLQNVMKDGQTLSDGLQLNKENNNGQRTDTDIQSRSGNRTETSSNGLYGARPSNDNGRIQPYIRRSESSSSNTGSIIHDPSPEFKAELEAQGKPVNSYKELAANSDEDAASFISNFRAANEINGKKAAQVYEYSPEEYKQMKLYTAENGKSGFALKSDGDIVSVFSVEKGSLAGMMNLAIQNGGKKLDCFDTFLPKIYKKFGFEEVNRVKWNEEYKPKDWDKDFFKQYNNGEPDVVYMKLRNEPSKPTGEPQQLKLDFNASPNDIGASIAKGDINLKEEGSIDAIINRIAKTDIDISGKTFKDVAADADSYFNQALKDNPQKAAAYFNAQSPEILDGIVRQQLAAAKLLSVLKDVQANANPRENLRILTAVKDIEKYIEGVGSGFGRGLRYQSITKKAVNTFGSERFSDLALQGINGIADILDSISLNFTRNQSLQEFKSEFLTNFQKHPSYNEIMGDRQMFSKLNDVLEETYNGLKAGKNVNSSEIIMEAMVKDEAETCGWYAKLADTTKGFVDTIKHWGNQAPSYVINNVLGIASAFKNVSSGAIQTNLYPTYRILGGFLTGNGEVTREGIDQWLGTFVNFGESMRLAKQAFINGDGLLTNTKEIVEGNLQDGFHKWATTFKEIGDAGFGITLQNIHSFIPRLMMASDEFMSQLNYRNIVRAKALSQARRETELIGDAAQTADEIFNKIAFTEDGKPLDFKAFVEAKDMLFQVPLNRKVYDPATGVKRETGMDKTLISGIGDWMQAGTQKFVPLRIFMPFVKTPANIADQALQANPLYAVLNNNTRKQFFSTDPETRAKAYGKMATMITLGAGFTFAAANGQITGSEPIDKKEKTALLKTGWRPYSIKIGGKWIPYMGMLTPLDSYMAFCADNVALAGKILSSEQEIGLAEMAGQILGNIMNDYIDQAGFRTNTVKLMDIFNPSTDVRVREQLAANTFSSFLPMSGNVNAIRSAVKTVKGNTEQKKPEGFYDNLVRNYTDIFTSPQDYRRDVFGNRVDQYGLIIAKATDDKFIQPEYAEMARMADKGYSPSNIAHLLKKTGVPLEEFKSQETGRSAYDAMYDELTEVKIGGKTLQESIAQLIQTPRYQSLNDGINSDGKDWSAVSYKTKKKLLDDTFQRYYTVAKRKVINKRGDEFVDKKGFTMKQRQQQVRLQMLNEKINQDLEQNLIHQIMKF